MKKSKRLLFVFSILFITLTKASAQEIAPTLSMGGKVPDKRYQWYHGYILCGHQRHKNGWPFLKVVNTTGKQQVDFDLNGAEKFSR